MSEATDFRAWLDQSEREAHDAIARSYAEGRAALGSPDGREDEVEQSTVKQESTGAAEESGSGEQTGDEKQN
ncbi:hypothetical protein SAMN05216266_11811 [Amycolatopsis marina]|uniref:Uncharacterized protein n=1 Tax=Amycolatopsis marina TaxID=490629 RepID=A0A1I1BXA6_9PSEU|nr:hypothetical protein [Amycolatopsis marina]SFB54336.1 hypothetical protein SAMN05216266_11811 [Amycolatopsis marina]